MAESGRVSMKMKSSVLDDPQRNGGQQGVSFNSQDPCIGEGKGYIVYHQHRNNIGGMTEPKELV